MSYAVRDFYLNGGAQAIIVRLFRPPFANETARQQAETQEREAAQSIAGAARGATANADATIESVAQAARDAVGKLVSPSAAALSVAQVVAQAVSDATKPISGADAADGAVDAAINNAAPVTKAGLDVGGLMLEAASEGAWGNNLRARVDYDDLDKIGERYAPLTSTDLFKLTVRDMKTGATERFLNLTVKDHARRADRLLKAQSNLVTVETLPTQVPTKTDKSDLTDAENKNAPFSKEDIELGDRSRSVAVTAIAFDSQLLDTPDYEGDEDNKTGIYALEKADLFNLMCIPPDRDDIDIAHLSDIYGKALPYCVKRRSSLTADGCGKKHFRPKSRAPIWITTACRA